MDVGAPADEELLAATKEAVALGRTTVVEVHFITNLVKSLTNPEQAIIDINEGIGDMESAEILSTDINPALWIFVNAVLRGQKLSAM